MKQLQLLFFLFSMAFLPQTSYAASAYGAATIATPAVNKTEAAAAKSLSKKERKALKKAKKAKRKSFRQKIKNAFKKVAAAVGLGALVIISILIPPLGMYLHDEDITNRFWISLILTILGWLPGVIYTLYIILSEN